MYASLRGVSGRLTASATKATTSAAAATSTATTTTGSVCLVRRERGGRKRGRSGEVSLE